MERRTVYTVVQDRYHYFRIPSHGGKSVRIVLLRHGESSVAHQARISACEFAAWIDEYNQAGIGTSSSPAQATMDMAVTCRLKLCSNLRRSIESMQTLCPGADFVACKLFREWELPHGKWQWLKADTSLWSVIFRLLWFLGYSYKAESVRQAKRRAQQAARMLADRARENQSVLLVGHYFVNRRIAKELVRNGWVGPTHLKPGYWASSVYEKETGTSSP